MKTCGGAFTLFAITFEGLQWQNTVIVETYLFTTIDFFVLHENVTRHTMRLYRLIIVLFLFAATGLLPSCSNIHMIALKPGERIIITREGVQQKGAVKGGNADEQDDEEGGTPERESNYFGQQHDIMQGGGKSLRNPFYKWDAIVGIGFTRIYGDLKYTQVQPAYKILIDRYLRKNVSLGLSLIMGCSRSMRRRTAGTDGLRIYNQFTSFSVNTRVSAGTLILQSCCMAFMQV